MGWFSKKDDDFFLATVVPNDDGARVAQYLGVVGIDFDYEVLGEANGMMMVSVSGTAVKMAAG